MVGKLLNIKEVIILLLYLDTILLPLPEMGQSATLVGLQLLLGREHMIPRVAMAHLLKATKVTELVVIVSGVEVLNRMISLEGMVIVRNKGATDFRRWTEDRVGGLLIIMAAGEVEID